VYKGDNNAYTLTPPFTLNNVYQQFLFLLFFFTKSF